MSDCSKIPYADAGRAAEALRHIARRQRARGRVEPVAVHPCASCRAWHVTSHPPRRQTCAPVAVGSWARVVTGEPGHATAQHPHHLEPTASTFVTWLGGRDADGEASLPTDTAGEIGPDSSCTRAERRTVARTSTELVAHSHEEDDSPRTSSILVRSRPAGDPPHNGSGRSTSPRGLALRVATEP
jgi:hypothetical protein